MLDATPVPDAPDPGELRRRVATAVQELRKRSGRSLSDVATAAGIGKSTLHAIEAGDANPGIETLWGLAQALGVPFGALLDQPSPMVRVVRAGEAVRVASEDSTMAAYLLGSTGHVSRVELYDLHLSTGPVRDADPHTEGTIEHVVVTAGRLRVGPIDGPVDLEVGDLAVFPADRHHRYEALESDTRAVMLIEYA